VNAIDRYEILATLDDRERVTTYLARDNQLPTHLRLKCAIYHYRLLPHLTVVPELFAQLVDRLDYLADLSRDRQWLATIYSYWIDGSELYIVGEAFAGANLATDLAAAGQAWSQERVLLLLADLLYLVDCIETDGIECTSLLSQHLPIHPVDAHFVLNLAALSIDRPSDSNLRGDVGKIAVAAATGQELGQTKDWAEKAIHISDPRAVQIIDRLLHDPSLTTATAQTAVRELQAASWNFDGKLELKTAAAHFTIAIPQQSPELLGLLHQGLSNYGMGNADIAILAYERAIELDPDAVAAYCGRGNARRYQGDYQGSWQDFDRAVHLDPNCGSGYIGRALAQSMQAGVSGLTTADFARGVELLAGATNAIDLMMRGTAHAQLGDPAGAIADYTQAIDIDPELTIAYNNRGNLQRIQGNYPAALADLTQAIAINPSSTISYNNRGIVYTDLQDFELAIADYTRAIALKPDFALAYNNRGNCHNDLGNYAAAIEDYNKSLVIKPDFAPAYSNRGNTHRLMENLTEAIEDYDRALELNPYMTVAIYNRGITRRRQGDHRGAIIDYTATIAQDPNHLFAYYHRANARQYIGDKGGAIADYTQVLRLNPQYVAAYYNRGVTRTNIGHLTDALADLQVSIDLAPDFLQAHYQQGYVRDLLGDRAGAIECYDRAIALNPAYLDAYYQRGRTHQEMGDLSSAVADFSQVLLLDRDYAPAYYHRAQIYATLSDRSGSIADYHRAASLYLDRGDTDMHQRILQAIDVLSS
jgi:tetratricopeptide (TPR) repeat protein